MLESWRPKAERQWVLGIDTSFVRKSGKATPNLGKYWDSMQNKAVRRLEVSCISLIDLDWGQAFGLHMRATEATQTAGRTELCAGHLHEVLGGLSPHLRQRIQYVVGDGYYAKQDFVAAVRQQGQHLVGKLRCDADLRYPFTGPHPLAQVVPDSTTARWTTSTGNAGKQ